MVRRGAALHAAMLSSLPLAFAIPWFGGVAPPSPPNIVHTAPGHCPLPHSSDPLPSEPKFTAEGWVAAAEGTYSFDVPGRLPIEFSLPGKTRDATRRTVRGFFGRIFQVSHLYLLKLATGATVTDFETILEFGAGTGEGADVAARLGFRGARLVRPRRRRPSERGVRGLLLRRLRPWRLLLELAPPRDQTHRQVPGRGTELRRFVSGLQSTYPFTPHP